MVKRALGFGSSLFLRVADHVEGDAGADVILGANSVNGFLRLAITPVASFNCVRRGGQPFVVQECQSFSRLGDWSFFKMSPTL
jgi:hypothetical protein